MLNAQLSERHRSKASTAQHRGQRTPSSRGSIISSQHIICSDGAQSCAPGKLAELRHLCGRFCRASSRFCFSSQGVHGLICPWRRYHRAEVCFSLSQFICHGSACHLWSWFSRPTSLSSFCAGRSTRRRASWRTPRAASFWRRAWCAAWWGTACWRGQLLWLLALQGWRGSLCRPGAAWWRGWLVWLLAFQGRRGCLSPTMLI
mmetsp:Transcript_155703/g.287026  ORF Transcript_155703/g.287026 Transcript_155703/m.287026 type:complete len:203 (+) Transcript_155703:881-1489(+)